MRRAAGVAALSLTVAAAVAAPLAPCSNELMQAIFGKTFNPVKSDGLAVLKDEGVEGYYLMTLVSSHALPDGRVAVVVNGSPSDEQRSDQSHHTSSGILNVYFLQRDGAQWKLVERHESVESIGYSGLIGEVTWVMLAPDKPGFVLSSGSSWQGYALRAASVFDLAGGVRRLGAFSEMSSSADAARYHYNGKEYVLISGDDAVPEI
jgi:hypothetical protein